MKTWREKRVHLIGWTVTMTALAVLVTACRADSTSGARYSWLSPDFHGEDVTAIQYLEQNWSEAESERWYFTAQGSQILPYDWFLVLEQPDSDERFRDTLNMTRYRFLGQVESPMNPDALPVGFVRDEGIGRDWLGVTCAACHTSQLDYAGVGYRIDGGPGQADMETFLLDLAEALHNTADDEGKFDRFYDALSAENPNTEGKSTIRTQLESVAETRTRYNLRNFPADHPAGYGRIDALGAILNEVMHRAVPEEEVVTGTENTERADAPVSYPFLWDTPQHDTVQWLGVAPNGWFGVKNLARNVGEVLGVFGNVDYREDDGVIGYRSSIKAANLLKLDRWLITLWSPEWPEAFPDLDAASVSAGAQLYQQNCLQCHALIDRDDPARQIAAQIAAVDTDSRSFDAFFDRNGSAGVLEGRIIRANKPWQRFGATASGRDILDHAVINTILAAYASPPPDPLPTPTIPPPAPPAPPPPTPPAYKARPLNGIWATAPYLHNGSVPTLYHLLLPPDERPSSFPVGSRLFDPVNVGLSLDVQGFPSIVTRDENGTSVPGDGNGGHIYGTQLAEDERMDLLEFLKSL